MEFHIFPRSMESPVAAIVEQQFTIPITEIPENPSHPSNFGTFEVGEDEDVFFSLFYSYSQQQHWEKFCDFNMYDILSSGFLFIIIRIKKKEIYRYYLKCYF